MPKRIRIFFLIISSPFLFMAAINEIPQVPERSHKYVKEYCTWSCHDVTCKHWKDSFKEDNTPVKKMHKEIFDWCVTGLHNNWLGLNYGAINLLVYIIGYPLIGSFLIWNLIRKIK